MWFWTRSCVEEEYAAVDAAAAELEAAIVADFVPLVGPVSVTAHCVKT